jgi:hypothetical protein
LGFSGLNAYTSLDKNLFAKESMLTSDTLNFAKYAFKVSSLIQLATKASA